MHSLPKMQTTKSLTYRFELKSPFQNLHIFILQSSIGFSECQSSSETSSLTALKDQITCLYEESSISSQDLVFFYTFQE